MTVSTRRNFLKTCAAAGTFTALPRVLTANDNRPAAIKPIRGSWISVLWNDNRHFYWNEMCRSYTAEQWDVAVRDVAELGMEYLVLLAVGLDGEAFYDTPVMPKVKNLACDDPIGAMLSAADKYGVKFFVSSDWYTNMGRKAMVDPKLMKIRFKMMGELAEKYGSHKSFHGWYWPNEACITPYYADHFIKYVNACSGEARRITPRAKTLIAPWGTHAAISDDRYVKQLETLDIDIIAYQDGVGCLRPGPEKIVKNYAALRKAHDKVPQRKLWADVETFAWEGPENRPTSRLIPGSFDRLERQLEAVSSYVDVVLIYQYQGLLSKPGTKAPAGPPDAQRLYRQYRDWLRKNHPDMIRKHLG